jgi:uncharacterized membrane protein
MVHRKNGTFYDSDWNRLPEFDVVIMTDVGSDAVSGRVLREIAEHTKTGSGLLVAGGQKAFESWSANRELAQVLPVEFAGAGYLHLETPLRVATDRREHPVLPMRALEAWTDLAPLSGYLPTMKDRQRGISLLYAPIDDHPPLLVAGTHGSGKVMVALSSSFWRLDLVTSGAGGPSEAVRQLWQNTVRWLAQRDAGGRLHAAPDREVYRAGEPIAFWAQVFDEFLRPQSGARVSIAVGDVSIELEEGRNGEYRGLWDGQGLEQGPHSFEASASIESDLIGEARGDFVIEQHSVEDADLRADTLLLQQIAQASGGRYRRLEDWPALMRSVNLHTHILEDIETFRLWGSIWPLVATIALLAMEWTIRKRVGMI